MSICDLGILADAVAGKSKARGTCGSRLRAQESKARGTCGSRVIRSNVWKYKWLSRVF